MKKAFLFTVLVWWSVYGAKAHELSKSAADASGAFGLKAEYIHVLINALPVYGIAIGAALLLASLFFRNSFGEKAALIILVCCGVSAWPVLYFGQHGYNHLYPQIDTESQAFLNMHMERAEKFIFVFYATAMFGIFSLISLKKLPKIAKKVSGLTLLISLIAIGIGGWISRAGGEVSHSEFRTEAAPTGEETSEGHHHSQH